jgi:hypothetical protein
MVELIRQAKQLMEEEGVFDQHALFNRIYPGSRKHYATVRRAIHMAKTGVFR